MPVKNCKMEDGEKGIFSVLGLVAVRITGPYWWHSEDIDDEMAKGSIFRAYEAEGGGDDTKLDIASVMVVDATNDPSEPDVSILEVRDVPSIDDTLHEANKAGLPDIGMQLIQWMSSELNEAENIKVLVSAYVVMDGKKKRQFISARFNAKGRKVVAVGIFDIAKKDVLAAPIFNVLRNIVVLT